MASDKNKKKKRIRSTARNLHSMWLLKLLGLFFAMDFVIIAAFIMMTRAYAEYTAFGKNRPDCLRDIRARNGVLWYEVRISDEAKEYYVDTKYGYALRFDFNRNKAEYILYDNQEMQSTDLTYAFMITIWMGAVILCFQIIELTDYMIRGLEPVRRRLRSLNEISEDAFKISTMPFDEDKIHDLETAISRITPDGPSRKLKTDDAELKGIEAAINAMIERLRDSYKQQARFVSDASHELRTPIAVIKGYADMLDRWGKNDEKILEESITAIKNEAKHMNELVEQLLFLARGDSGRQPVNIEEVSLYDLMKEVYEESLMIDESHIYEFKGEPGVKAMVDVAMIKQSARILIDNAAKYTQPRERIIIGCFYNAQKRPAFYIQDNGMGMNENDVKHVFERFYRADNARYSKQQGNGLGLSIAKWIVDRHGGYFEVLSREEIGTRITVVL